MSGSSHGLTLLWDEEIDDCAVVAAFAKQLETAFELFKERQRKYGRENIAGSGEFGVWVRSTDKDTRLRRAYSGEGADVPDETIDDTWRDRLVYSGIALMVRDGQWPGAQRYSPPRRGDGSEQQRIPGFELGPHT